MFKQLIKIIKLKIELRDVNTTLKALYCIILENGWDEINTQTINKWNSLWSRKKEILKELSND